ncbi:hypothetical protein ACN08Y_10745 [Rothia sp. P5764]|uniref:hypothetical protein n=1 Tax=Rothia sp. P5764 TaxID=3402654 RepID=UPI003ACCB2CA
MSISTADFDAWVDQVALGVSLRKIAEKSGLSVSTISLQRREGKVRPEIIMKIASAFSHSKLRELSRFEGYESVYPVPDFADMPWLSCVKLTDLIAELLFRGGVAEPAADYIFEVGEDACSRWRYCIGGGEKRKEVSEVLGLMPHHYSRLVKSNSLRFEMVLKVANFYKVTPHVGLVACGYISLSDIGIVDVASELRNAQKKDILEQLDRESRSLVTWLSRFD